MKSVLSVVFLVYILSMKESSAIKRQIFTGSNLGQRNQCILDDLQEIYLEPLATIALLSGVTGACPERSGGDAVTVGPSTIPGIRVPFREINNTLNGPACIALMANTARDNIEPVALFYDSNTTELGRIELTQSEINVTLRDSFASFIFPKKQGTVEYLRLQLCMDGERIDFYYGCALMGSKSFVSGGFQDSDMIVLLRRLSIEMVDPYLNSVAQFYLISCSGPGVETDNVVALQCKANPPNCSEVTASLQEVVSSYVLKLEGEAVPTSTPVLCSPSTVVLIQQATSAIDSVGCVPIPSQTEIPKQRVCELSDKEAQLETLRGVLGAVTAVLGTVALVLLVLLIAVCVLWRRAASHN